MIDDRRLQHLLRAAVRPVADGEPSRDLWPLVVSRVQAPMRRSWLDVSLAAAVAVVLLIFPEWLLVLAYHL